MTTRATKLSPLHVEALNQIDIEFYNDKKYKKVIAAWKNYHDFLVNFPPENEQSNALFDKMDELFVDLLFEMGKSLGYEFDRVHIKRATYFPRGHGEIEQDQHTLRKALVAILTGKKTIPMSVLDFLSAIL